MRHLSPTRLMITLLMLPIILMTSIMGVCQCQELGHVQGVALNEELEWHHCGHQHCPHQQAPSEGEQPEPHECDSTPEPRVQTESARYQLAIPLILVFMHFLESWHSDYDSDRATPRADASPPLASCWLIEAFRPVLC